MLAILQKRPIEGVAKLEEHHPRTIGKRILLHTLAYPHAQIVTSVNGRILRSRSSFGRGGEENIWSVIPNKTGMTDAMYLF